MITPVLPNLQSSLGKFGLLGKAAEGLILHIDLRYGEENSGTWGRTLGHLQSSTQQERRQRSLLIF